MKYEAAAVYSVCTTLLHRFFFLFLAPREPLSVVATCDTGKAFWNSKCDWETGILPAEIRFERSPFWSDVHGVIGQWFCLIPWSQLSARLLQWSAQWPAHWAERGYDAAGSSVRSFKKVCLRYGSKVEDQKAASKTGHRPDDLVEPISTIGWLMLASLVDWFSKHSFHADFSGVNSRRKRFGWAKTLWHPLTCLRSQAFKRRRGDWARALEVRCLWSSGASQVWWKSLCHGRCPSLLNRRLILTSGLRNEVCKFIYVPFSKHSLL